MTTGREQAEIEALRIAGIDVERPNHSRVTEFFEQMEL